MKPEKCIRCGHAIMLCHCKPKPRVRFCWECGRGLRGNYFTEQMVDRHLRILHKQCWDRIKDGDRRPLEMEHLDDDEDT